MKRDCSTQNSKEGLFEKRKERKIVRKVQRIKELNKDQI